MTRAEDDAIKREYQHADYMKRREAKLAYAKQYAIVNVSALNVFEDGASVTNEALVNAGLVKKVLDGVKILGGGELTKKLTVSVDKVTASAKEKIEAIGGKVEVK